MTRIPKAFRAHGRRRLPVWLRIDDRARVPPRIRMMRSRWRPRDDGLSMILPACRARSASALLLADRDGPTRRQTTKRSLQGTPGDAAVLRAAADPGPQVTETTKANPVTKSADAQGLHVFGRQGVKLGTVREVFLDLASGTLEFVIVEAASLLGGSGKYHPVPWAAIRYDPVATGFQIEMTKDAFKASPSYDREQLANPNFGWAEQASRHFSSPAPGSASDDIQPEVGSGSF